MRTPVKGVTSVRRSEWGVCLAGKQVRYVACTEMSQCDGEGVVELCLSI